MSNYMKEIIAINSKAREKKFDDKEIKHMNDKKIINEQEDKLKEK